MGSIDTVRDASRSQPRSRIEEAGAALVIIAIGVAFLAGNLGFHLPFLAWHNGWALFILFGAVAPASRAVARYRVAGRVDAIVAKSLLSAGVAAAIAAMFLLDVSFGVWWPVFLVIGGLYMLIPGGNPKSSQ
jgi:hypothetical protein